MLPNPNLLHFLLYLLKNDVKGFLTQVLSERELLGLPPFSYQALVHAEHRSVQEAKRMLSEAAEKASADFDACAFDEAVYNSMY